MRRNRRAKFSEQIKDAIEHSGMTRYRIAKETGISESVLSRFISGQTGMNLGNLDKLADLLGLRVIVDTGKQKGR